jgi:DNA repair protein RadA/Sms
LIMLIAVMTKRSKLNLGNQDIYTNIAGGLRVRETALDLPVCLAIASSFLDQPIEAHTAVFGEVSLSGEIKPALGQQKRLDQAKKLGYNKFINAQTASTLDEAMRQAFPKRPGQIKKHQTS